MACRPTRVRAGIGRLVRVWISPRARYALIPLAVLPLVLIRAAVLAESDTFWQIRTGLDILRTHHIPVADSYSWTVSGRQWHPNSWLFDVLLALAYRGGGMVLAALAAATFIPLIALAVTLLARRLGAQPGITLLVILLGLIPMFPWLSARPQMVDYPSTVLLVLLIDIAMMSVRARVRWWAVGGLGLLQMVWVNLHLAAMIAVAIAAACVAGHLLVRRSHLSRADGGWAAVAVLATVAGTLVNPVGVKVFALGLQVRESSTVIIEWSRLSLTDHLSQGLLLVSLVAVVVGWRKQWYPLVVPMAGLAVAGCFSIRLLPFAAVLGLPTLAAACGRTPRVAEYLQSRRTLVAIAVCGLIASEAVVAVIRSVNPVQARYPLAVIRMLPSGCKLFNSYRLGGPVILLRPDIPVSQDSRSDLYGKDALLAAGRIENRADGRARLDELGITCVLVEPSRRLGDDLAGDPGWRRVAGDEFGTVFVRLTNSAAVA